MSGSTAGKDKSMRRKLIRKGPRTRDVTTQCGKWLQLKKAIEKDEKLRAEVLQVAEKVSADMRSPKPNEDSAEEERMRQENREELTAPRIVDLALKVQPLNTCKWNV